MNLRKNMEEGKEYMFKAIVHKEHKLYGNLNNSYLFRRWRIDPSELSLSQRRRVDKLMTLFQPCLEYTHLESLLKNLITDFIEITNKSEATDIFTYFRSIESQVIRKIQNKNKIWKKDKLLEVPAELLEVFEDMAKSKLRGK